MLTQETVVQGVQYWNHLPTSVKTVVIGVVVKYLADLIRAYKSRLNGKAMHIVAGVLASGITILQALVTTGSVGDWGTLALNSALALTAAIGYNEITKPKIDSTLPGAPV